MSLRGHRSPPKSESDSPSVSNSSLSEEKKEEEKKEEEKKESG